MPVENDEYRKLTDDEIEARLKSALRDELDTSAEFGELVEKQLSAEAKTLAQNQEQALERVYEAAYLSDASGKELDKLVEIIGLERRSASSSTGTVKLSRSTPPKFNYTVPKGEVVQTGGTNSIQFETTQVGALEQIDSFESGTLDKWGGDVSSFSVNNGSLQIPSSANLSIYTENSEYRIGTTFVFSVNCGDGSSFGIQFGYQDQSNYYECEIDQASQDLYLRLVTEGTEDSISTNNSAEIPTGEIYVEVTWGLYEDHTAEIYSTKERDNLLCSVSLNENTGWTAAPLSLSSADSDTSSSIHSVSTRAVHLNVEAVGSGPETNVGPRSISQFEGNPEGIESVTNPVATGNPDFVDTEGLQFVLGEQRETDEQLRERAYDSTSIGGAATASALDAELKKIEGVRSVKLNRNRESTETNGLPGHSFEAVVYGGTDQDIGRTIFETASIDSHDVGGVNGTKASYIVNTDVVNGTEEINWSRPERLTLDITLDLVVGDNYVGENEIRSIVAEYIGGTGLDGKFINGLSVGEDIYRAVLLREIVGPDETGVWEVDNVTIDKSGDGTDDITTTSSGAEVLSVGDSQVAVTNARDGSITINTTQK